MKKITLIASLLLVSQQVLAEDSGIPGTVDTAVNTGNAGDTWKVTLGGGIASVPRYEGAAGNRMRAVPLIEADLGHFFISTSRGIGYNLSDDNGIQYGPRATIARPRKQSVDAHLNGMGDMGYTAELGGFFNARFSPWYFASDIAASSRGAHLELGGGYEMRLSESDKLRAGLDVNWANGKYMQSHFGVNAAQSTASGGVLTAYNATSGVRDYALKLNWMHNYSKQWFSNAGVSFKQLAGSAKNSPLTMRNSNNTVNFVVGYHF